MKRCVFTGWQSGRSKKRSFASQTFSVTLRSSAVLVIACGKTHGQITSG